MLPYPIFWKGAELRYLGCNTTKTPGHGTGLGPPVVRNILEECGGDLSVESPVGKGSAFSFRLPVVAPPC